MISVRRLRDGYTTISNTSHCVLKPPKYCMNTHELFGDKLNYLSADDLKCIVKDEMLQFVTRDTLNVMFSGCDLDAQSVEQIATILCRYPLIKLLLQIQEQQVDGRKLIHMLIKDTNNALNIKTETGWTNDDVEQIRLLVLKHMVLSQNEFMNKMENICKSTNTDHTLQQILQLNELDMEQIQYDIKRNRDVHEFSDMVIEAVDQLLEQTPSDDVEVHTIYSTIAKCFVCDDHYLNDWVCCNCGNYNFSKVINGALHSDLRHCTLCGISHTDSIVFKIRNRPTFVTSYSAIPSDVKDGNQTATNGTDRLIQNIVNKQAIDLCCNERNDNASCPSILRLTHCLIQYKQWMSKVHAESKENEPNTLTVDIGVITNDTLKQIFMDAVDAIQIQAAKVHAFDVDLLMKIFDDNVD
eukprot:694505_1